MCRVGMRSKGRLAFYGTRLDFGEVRVGSGSAAKVCQPAARSDSSSTAVAYYGHSACNTAKVTLALATATLAFSRRCSPQARREGKGSRTVPSCSSRFALTWFINTPQRSGLRGSNAAWIGEPPLQASARQTTSLSITRSAQHLPSPSSSGDDNMLKKDKPMMSVTAIIQGAQAQHWNRGISLDSSLSISSMAPQSPLDIKPETAALLTGGSFSPTGGPNSPNSFPIGHSSILNNSASGQSKSSTTSPYPPNHPLSGSKHLCSICGDRASGKHYGVYSCEGCKGFFKRTVRKDLSYACREDKNCIIDKRQRNRCQYCRYQKCLAMGMKREAVQEERQRTKERDQNEVESTSSLHTDMPVERILEAEKRVECKAEHQMEFENSVNSMCPAANICQATNKQLFQLVEWAKHIPHFSSLPLEDQVLLLRAGWNELLIAAFSHRSVDVKDGIVLATGLTVHRNSAHQAGVGTIFDRVLTELVAKMREMKMDKTELGCLRSVILFNPDVRGLKSGQEVELLREKVYAALEEYTRSTHPDEPGRFAKLLLRLPSLRSIGLKCLEHLFFFRLIGDVPIDTFLMEMLESPSDP